MKSSFCDQVRIVCSGNSELEKLSLEEILAAIPRIDELDIPAGQIVILRADIDVPLKNGKVVDYARIDSILETIKYCLNRGWKIVIMGHIGRDAANTAKPVADALSDILKIPCTFIPDWMNESEDGVKPEIRAEIDNSPDDSFIMLENTRCYNVERAVWGLDDIPDTVCVQMERLAKSVASIISDVEINEAIAASNLDFSSTFLPLRMGKTALGFFITSDLKTHMIAARTAEVAVISGLKPDKLDNLEEMLERKVVRWVIAAGSLAMALRKAKAIDDGIEFSIGRAENDKEYKGFVSQKRLDQALRIVRHCKKAGIKLSLPVDFILEDGTVSETIPANTAQLDVGPKTSALLRDELTAWTAKKHETPPTIFYNGVFGFFEDPNFATGTEKFIQLLKELTAKGVKTYVGGGEGRLALLKFGHESEVTYAFTAGGTVLKSLSNRHIGFLKAMYLQNTKSGN